MSRRRYLSTDISTDGRVNTVARQCGDFAALLYTWMVPHADDRACLKGTPEEILYQVMPGRRDKTADDVAAALEAMAVARLIQWDCENNIIGFPPPSFYKYQTYIKADNRRKEDLFTDQRKTPQNAEDQRKTMNPGMARPESTDDINLFQNQRKTPQNAASLSLPVSVSVSPSLPESPDGDSSSAGHPPTVLPPIDPPSEVVPPDNGPMRPPDTPYQEIVELFNATCPSLPQVETLSDTRNKYMRARWKEKPDIERFRAVFQKAESSNFLSGRDGKWSNCSFDWLIRPSNWVKVLDGNYDNRASPNVPLAYQSLHEWAERDDDP